ncbi:hypothetical protein GCM10025876_40360 [Demequina litorisediminis]|uniref:DUF5979 domain-containing protein n=1 Tax=Demequina litorisediminis TaxID=1849022 RepID=A0ABQ6IJ66_9MICO|nr:hypothetical protein GCM10025876_39780 [Demequina litorisediminis]GMA37832.1 hypothetical protein GCM10025876_40360 [Demequina litorisediminis]
MGTECEVSAVAEPLAAAVSLDAQSVTITREAPSIVTAAYTFNKNTLRVTQGTLGSGARTAWAPSTFPTTVKCSTDSGLVGVKTFTAAAGTSHAVTGLPTGASLRDLAA